ncbi:MAG: nucleotidyltransferase family protein [Synergistaceae bacterium]|nr:nucleotidyltransferase family protein [Synergistaceae bacterium]
MRESEVLAAGVIAEYNPLHNGHRLMMEAVREKLGDVPIVVALTSNFTQRGEPALCDKWTRARMALRCGADLVLELPFLFSCAAAPDFSAGAVDLLARTRLVTHLAFGMENPQEDVNPILNILLNEPPEFKRRLNEKLKRGASYPKAASLALEALIPGGGAFISSPNNLLALSYLLHIKRKSYPLIPLSLPRRGGSHAGLELGPLASAGAIRAALNEGARLESDGPLAETMPPCVLSLLREARDAGRLYMSYNAENKTLWPLLQAFFLRSAPEELRRIDGMDEGIENLFIRHWRDAESFSNFVGRCVSARYTQGHIRRRLIRLLLGIDRWTAQAVRRAGVPYARVLGFTERGRELMNARKHDSELPLITRLSSAKGPIGKRAAQMEFRAADLYELLVPCPDLQHEERQRPVNHEGLQPKV